jgi:putative FmdB family regulatory protein
MPLYEYRCMDCGTEFEKRLSFSEADQRPVCPECASAHTQKKLSRVISFNATSAAGAAASTAAGCGSSGAFT